jgi:capsular polysaccharide biosynthesis protein
MTSTELVSEQSTGAVDRRTFLRAHAVLIVSFAAIVTLSAGVFSYLQPSTYTSVSRVVVEPQLLPNGGAPPSPDMGTEKAVATSSAVTAAAAGDLQLPRGVASAGLSVAVPVDTQVLEFRYTGEDPREAARRVAAFSQAYVDYRSFHSTSSRKLVPESAEIITPASMPSAPSGPNHLLQIGAALLLGLALGTGIAAASEIWDRHVRGPGHLAELIGSPVLAVVPRPRVPGPERLVVTASPRSAAAEAYRFLQVKVLDPMGRQGVQTLVVTCASDRDREARDLVSSNLAAAAAEAGRSVVIVPDTADKLPLAFLPGAGNPSLDTTMEVIDLLKSTITGVPQEGQSTERTAAAEQTSTPAAPQQPRQGYDVVILQAAPLQSSARTLLRLRQSDACLLVVDAQLSMREDVQEAHREATHGSFGPVTTVLTYPCSARRAGIIRGRAGHRRLVRTSTSPLSSQEDLDLATAKGIA